MKGKAQMACDFCSSRTI